MRFDTTPLCEQLENRRLLAATLVDGVLKVVGTRGDDEINVSDANPNVIDVNINGAASRFAVADVRRVIIHGRDGNDSLSVGVNNFWNQVTGVFPFGVYITGGPGDDLISGSIYSDQIFGGDGNDEVYGMAGDDFIDGGNGNDQIYGGYGNDSILGAAGDDEVYGDVGDDRMFGGDGNDRLYGEDGNDLFAGGMGADRFYGGKGNDRVLIPLRGPASGDFVPDQTNELHDWWLL